jgi:SAM-dependent methyltransferase
VSEGQPPRVVAPHRDGWLTRLIRGAVRVVTGIDLEAARRKLDNEAAARQELQSHLEKRLDETAAVVEDVRGAFLAARSELETLRDATVPDLLVRVHELYESAGTLKNEVVAVRDQRLPQAEQARVLLHTTAQALEKELEALRDRRLPQVEEGVTRLHHSVEAVQGVAEEVRDRRLPALSARVDALVERLYEDVMALGGLVDRLAQREPLRVAVEPEIEQHVPAAMAAASTAFMDAFRGPRDETLGRVAEYVPLLAGAAPVLELGCGRGELLEALRSAGIVARGVDHDPAMVAACRRLGFEAQEGDALEVLRGVAPASLGGVIALHVFEHLPAATWMSIVEAASTALRCGGVLLVESPNPESLRVGAGLFWVDPTHRAPIHPYALAFVMRALGLEVIETRMLHPFPPEQNLANPAQPAPVHELASRLDAWLSGPRDFMVLARKP